MQPKMKYRNSAMKDRWKVSKGFTFKNLLESQYTSAETREIFPETFSKNSTLEDFWYISFTYPPSDFTMPDIRINNIFLCLVWYKHTEVLWTRWSSSYSC